jgi:hypothetical protein
MHRKVKYMWYGQNNSFGSKSSGGNEMGMQENHLQVKDFALVCFLTCYKSMVSNICESGHL